MLQYTSVHNMTDKAIIQYANTMYFFIFLNLKFDSFWSVHTVGKFAFNGS